MLNPYETWADLKQKHWCQACHSLLLCFTHSLVSVEIIESNQNRGWTCLQRDQWGQGAWSFLVEFCPCWPQTSLHLKSLRKHSGAFLPLPWTSHPSLNGKWVSQMGRTNCNFACTVNKHGHISVLEHMVQIINCSLYTGDRYRNGVSWCNWWSSVTDTCTHSSSLQRRHPHVQLHLLFFKSDDNLWDLWNSLILLLPLHQDRSSSTQSSGYITGIP